MNVEIRTEAAQFPEKEYIKGIFVVVVHILYTQCTSEQVSLKRTGFFRKQDLFISIGSDQINSGILSYICTKIAHYDTVQNFTKLLK